MISIDYIRLYLIKELKMLVLSRKQDETIIIKIPDREDIKLTIVKIDSMNKVRIGVEAEKDVVILRSELNKKESESRKTINSI
jgi:carbon storage regulator CsrA